MHRRLMILVLSSFFFIQLFSQKDYVDADGRIEYHNRIPLAGATLKLYNGDKLVETIKTGKKGEYHFKLEYNKVYTLEVSKDKLITKLIKYNTTMPTKIRGAWWIGIPINLYEICPGIDASVFSEPVVIVEFNERKKEYRANPDHDDKMRKQLQTFEQKNEACLEVEFTKLIRNADELSDQKKYKEAKELYEEASEKRPWETYAEERLTEMNDKIAQQEASANVFENMVAHGDRLLNSGNLAAAKNAYKRALVVNPSDTYTRNKIDEIDKTLQQEVSNQQQQKNAENRYNQIINQADNALQAQNFSLAERFYSQSLEIKPNKSYPKTQISKIKTLLAQEQVRNQEQERRKEEYNQKIQAGDALLSQSKYSEAKVSYLAAQQISPNETYPSQKLKEIDDILRKNQLLAKENELAYTNALRAGNLYFQQKKYELAKSEYNKAITLRPDEVLPKTQIIKINQIIADEEKQKQQQQALAEREQKYNDLVASADKLFEAKDYVRAKNTYNLALGIKSDGYPDAQVQKIEEIILLQEQEKQAAIERENNFKQAVAKADELYDKKDFYNAKEMYETALAIKPNDDYSSSRVKSITAFLQKLEASKTNNNNNKPVAVKPQSKNILPELKFKDDAELELYLVELRERYPEGITHEIYNGEREVMDRYIIIRQNETKEFRKIRYNWGGIEFWINDKPCTSMYFNSQTKQRAGEYYNKVVK